MSKKKYNLPIQAYRVPNTTNVFGGTDGGASDDSGSIIYDTTVQSLAFFDGTTWNYLPSDNRMFGETILVDTNHPNATDTRSGLSLYSKTRPFKTIQGAVTAAIGFAEETIYISTGTYTESVLHDYTISGGKNFNIIYDNSIHNGVSNTSALKLLCNNNTVKITLIQSSITNAGNSGDRVGSAALYVSSAGAFHLTGVGGTHSNGGYATNEIPQIVSVEGDTVYTSVVGGASLSTNNIRLTSTNGHAFEVPGGGGDGIGFTDTTFISTNSSAIFGLLQFEAVRCTIKGSTYGIQYPSNMLAINYLRDCYVESTTGNAIGGGSLGGNSSRVGKFFDTELVSYNEAISFGSGNVGISFNLYIRDCRITITNPATVTTFSFPDTGSGPDKGYVDLRNVSSNRQIQTTFTNTIINMGFTSTPNKYTVAHDVDAGDFYFSNNGLYVGAGANGTSGSMQLYIANASTVPSTPSGGGVLYVESGALKYKGSSGTITTLGAA